MYNTFNVHHQHGGGCKVTAKLRLDLATEASGQCGSLGSEEHVERQLDLN